MPISYVWLHIFQVQIRDGLAPCQLLNLQNLVRFADPGMDSHVLVCGKKPHGWMNSNHCWSLDKLACPGEAMESS